MPKTKKAVSESETAFANLLIVRNWTATVRFYSLRKLFTGFIRAAFTLWKLTALPRRMDEKLFDMFFAFATDAPCQASSARSYSVDYFYT